MYRGDNTVFHLFVKRILKYLAVLLVLILMLIPVFIVSYGNIRQNILKEYTDSVNKGAGALDSQVDSVVKIAAILKEEKSYRNLLKISGELDPSQYPDLIALQKKLTTFSVSHDYIKDLYLLFRNNTVYVSNFICDDDYTRVYPRFLYEQDTGREAWRGSYFSGNETVAFGPASPLSPTMPRPSGIRRWYARWTSIPIPLRTSAAPWYATSISGSLFPMWFHRTSWTAAFSI